MGHSHPVRPPERLTDRLAQAAAWVGERARGPHGPAHSPWPVRVDAFFEDGVGEEDVERWAQSASILDSNGDATDIAVKDGRIVGVRGRAADRINHGGWTRRTSSGGRPTPRRTG